MWPVAAMRESGRATLGRAPVSETPAAASAPAPGASPEAPTARGRAIRPLPVEQSNPTYGPSYWALGVLAASPALLCGLVFLVPGLRLPRVPRLELSVLLGVLVVVLVLANVVAHQLDYPAWSQPLVTMLPVVGLYLPAALLHGQAVALANGDPDPVVAAPALVSWLLLALSAMLTVIWGLVVGRHAPSYLGTALAPLPVLLAWAVALAADFREEVVVPALASAFALLALAAFVAWVVPDAQRPFVPLLAVGVQLAAFWVLRLPWPAFQGAVRVVIGLDLALFAALVLLVGLAPVAASWMRRAGWPEIQRLLGR